MRMRYGATVVLGAAVAVALTGCGEGPHTPPTGKSSAASAAPEDIGAVLVRECGQIADAAMDPSNATNDSVATVRHGEIMAVITKETWAITPPRKELRDAAQRAERNYKTREFIDTIKEKHEEEYSAAWREAFEKDLTRRKEFRDKMIRECVWRRGTKADTR